MCDALAEEGEHPEWHTYEMTLDHNKSIAYTKLYEKGYFRIRSRRQYMYIQGLSQSLENHKYILKEIKDKYQCKLTIYKI